MGNIVIGLYQQGDIYKIMDESLIELFNVKEEYINPKYSYSLHDEYCNVLGCAGYRDLWNGVMEGWLHVKKYEYFYDYKIAIIKYIMASMEIVFENGIHRIQGAVQESDIRSRKFHELLGFKNEGIMKKYGPDKSNYVMYARVK